MKYSFIFALALLTATTAFAQSDDHTAVIIELKSENIVIVGDKIRVKDIADVLTFVGANQNERITTIRAEHSHIGKFNSRTKHLSIKHAAIRSALIKSGFKSKNIEIKGPKEVQVKRKTIRVGNRRILDMAKRHIKNALVGIDETARMKFAGHIKPVEIPVARWGSSLRIDGDPKNPQYIGRVELRLIAELGAVNEVVAVIPVMVTREVLAIRLARPVKKGTILKRSDIELEKREVSNLGTQLFFRVSDVVGMIAKRDMIKGDDILKTDIKSTPVIRPDDLINVRVKAGLLTVETVCLALQAGSPGDRILVQNIESKGQFTAIVVDSKTAEVRRK